MQKAASIKQKVETFYRNLLEEEGINEAELLDLITFDTIDPRPITNGIAYGINLGVTIYQNLSSRASQRIADIEHQEVQNKDDRIVEE